MRVVEVLVSSWH